MLHNFLFRLKFKSNIAMEMEGMEINILLRKEMGMFLYTTMRMGIRSWEWEGIESTKLFPHISTQ